LLITDGEELDAGAMGAALEAKKAGIRIYSVGVGTEKGAPIPNKEGGGFRKKQNGEIVFSKLNEARLAELAEATGGAFVRSVTDDTDLVKIYKNKIRSDLKALEQKSTRVKRFEERFQWPLGIAIALFLAELFLSLLVRSRAKLASAVAVFLLVLPGLSGVFFESRAWAQPFTTKRFQAEKKYGKGEYADAAKYFEDALIAEPTNPDLGMNLGAAYYKRNEFAKAEEAWKSALRNIPKEEMESRLPEHKTRVGGLLYNLGNASYKQGKLEDAVNYYRAAKEKNTDDREAAHNLELALAELKKRKQQQNEQKQKSQEQKEQEKQQEKQSQNRDQEQQKKQEQRQQDKQDSGEKEEPKEEPKDTRQNNAQQQPQIQKQERQNQKLSKEDAERLLNSLNDEKKKPKQERRMPQPGVESGYDW
jgi:Ca-activated chloride channel family protein